MAGVYQGEAGCRQENSRLNKVGFMVFSRGCWEARNWISPRFFEFESYKKMYGSCFCDEIFKVIIVDHSMICFFSVKDLNVSLFTYLYCLVLAFKR